MKSLASLATFFACTTLSLLSAEERPPTTLTTESALPCNMQLLLEKDATAVLLEVCGPYDIFNPHDSSKVASGVLGKRFMIHELETGLKWGEEFPGIHQIQILPRSPKTRLFVNGIQYGGSLTIYGVGGVIHVVNHLDIETYVKAMLASQFSYPLDPEVMAALAILTRTDAYYHAMKNPESFWHLTAAEIGYQGSALIVEPSPLSKAVDSTKHLILVHSQGGYHLPFAATWTEHSAGKTAPYSSLFRKESFAPLSGVEAPHAALVRQDTKWTYQIGKQKLAQLLELTQLKAIELFVDRPSNKVYAVRVKDAEGSYDLDFFTLQERLGKERLQSSDFTVTIQGDHVLFSGFGKGHGVGLCLYSAGALAQNGENALKILTKFFPETQLYNMQTSLKRQ